MSEMSRWKSYERTMARYEDTRLELAARVQARESAERAAREDAMLAAALERAQPVTTRPPITPVEDGGSELRPRTLNEVVGQSRLKPLLRRLIDTARDHERPLPHLLFVGDAGTGKTTLATVIAREVGTRAFVLEAPLDLGVLTELRQAVADRDVVVVDEVHKQCSGDRRGITQACDPEQFYAILEDGVLATPTGSLPFPRLTWIGCTTDVGLLPVSLSDRFVIQPHLAPYTLSEMAELARRNAAALDLTLDDVADGVFAAASRNNPRQINNYLRAAQGLGGIHVSRELAREVIVDLCGTTLDGLTASMQAVLRYLLLYCGRETKQGTVYAASVSALATAAGHGRDTKAIALMVEPELLRRGYLQVRPQGRFLTSAGIERARQLI